MLQNLSSAAVVIGALRVSNDGGKQFRVSANMDNYICPHKFFFNSLKNRIVH